MWFQTDILVLQNGNVTNLASKSKKKFIMVLWDHICFYSKKIGSICGCIFKFKYKY